MKRNSISLLAWIIVSFLLFSSVYAEEIDQEALVKANAWVVEESGKLTPEKETAFAWLDEHQYLGEDISAYIWHYPELGLAEYHSTAILQDFMKKSGFTVEAGVAGQETAFVASWGEGKPVIGFHGEFDALPGLSQVAGSAEKQVIAEGGPGHGCGHNLFGTYSAMAAIATKAAMQQHGLKGTVKLYGTPAEETMIGKAFFVKYGIYDDADIVISWHPGADNKVSYGSSLAMDSFKVRFKGVASHAASAPWEGRSALDGVELMSVGMNYMREHVRPESRIMSCVTNGGLAPNVVPPEAEVWYFVRAPRYKTVAELMEWTKKIAEGAAMMSQTEMEFLKITGGAEYLPNNVLARIGDANVKLIGAPQWTEEDQQAAAPISKTKGVEEGPFYADETEHADLDKPFEWATGGGSIDEANTSWVVPMVRFSAATRSKGVPGHSWQMVAENCMEQAYKGSLVAAKYMAATAIDLYLNQKLIDAAKEEHQKMVEKHGPFIDPVGEIDVPSFELTHGMKLEQMPKQWEIEPYPYPESLEKYSFE